MEMVGSVSEMNSTVGKNFKISDFDLWNFVFFLFGVREEEEQIIPDHKRDQEDNHCIHIFRCKKMVCN